MSSLDSEAGEGHVLPAATVKHGGLKENSTVLTLVIIQTE